LGALMSLELPLRHLSRRRWLYCLWIFSLPRCSRLQLKWQNANEKDTILERRKKRKNKCL
jgi:hypothetical protein